ncbi:MFS-type transporter, partial [Cladobotryum mycophilum]
MEHPERGDTLKEALASTNASHNSVEENSSSNWSGAPPDGGRQAWIQVLGSFFIWMNTLGLLASFGVFEAFYLLVELRGTPPSNIAWIGSTQIAVFLISGILSGYLYDLGYLTYLLMSGTILMTIGMAMASISHKLWQFILSQGICTGLGLGLVFVPTIGVTTQWF